MPIKLLYLSSIFGGLLLTANVNAGELYRWVDDDGRVHFGDRPRPTQRPRIFLAT
ncbi:DUF4124 domain-containing protein [Microbulbifer sp. MKSA007]|nr:DUF4124 domain-containing protein [Microbulbifer sp. MKSA007]